MLDSPGLGTARPLIICTPRMLGAITVLHPWRPFSPVGARCLKGPAWRHAGPASETTAARSVESTAAWGMHPTTATWGVHPTSATKSMHMTLGGGQATACKERYPYSHGYHYRLHFFAPLENC